MARAPLAKAEIRADDHMRKPQPVADHRLRKVARGERREGGVEIDLIESLYAQFLQPVRARIAAHQAEGRCIGGEIFTRMRLECKDSQGRARLAPGRARLIYHRQ